MLVFYTTIVFAVGAVAERKQLTNKVKDAISLNYRVAINYFKGLTSKPTEKLYISFEILKTLKN